MANTNSFPGITRIEAGCYETKDGLFEIRSWENVCPWDFTPGWVVHRNMEYVNHYCTKREAVEDLRDAYEAGEISRRSSDDEGNDIPSREPITITLS